VCWEKSSWSDNYADSPDILMSGYIKALVFR